MAAQGPASPSQRVARSKRSPSSRLYTLLSSYVFLLYVPVLCNAPVVSFALRYRMKTALTKPSTIAAFTPPSLSILERRT